MVLPSYLMLSPCSGDDYDVSIINCPGSSLRPENLNLTLIPFAEYLGASTAVSQSILS